MDVDYAKLVPIRATITVGITSIQTRYTLNIFETHVSLTFPDAKGLKLVLSLDELDKLKDIIEERRAINKHGGG